MKRTVLVGILGIASTTSILAQGHILISNYLVPPYNQVTWEGVAVNDPLARIQIYYGKGVLTENSQLTPGISFGINPALNYDPGLGYGPGGYFNAQIQVLPDWLQGDTYTFMLVGFFEDPGVSGVVGIFSRTPVWTEQSAIVNTGLPASTATTVPAWIIIPEPSTLALAGVGLAAAILFRRRKHVRSESD